MSQNKAEVTVKTEGQPRKTVTGDTHTVEVPENTTTTVEIKAPRADTQQSVGATSTSSQAPYRTDTQSMYSSGQQQQYSSGRGSDQSYSRNDQQRYDQQMPYTARHDDMKYNTEVYKTSGSSQQYHPQQYSSGSSQYYPSSSGQYSNTRYESSQPQYTSSTPSREHQGFHLPHLPNMHIPQYVQDQYRYMRDEFERRRPYSNSMDVNQLKNPLMATALGITLALALWSLSHIPHMVKNAFTHDNYSHSYDVSNYREQPSSSWWPHMPHMPHLLPHMPSLPRPWRRWRGEDREEYDYDNYRSRDYDYDDRRRDTKRYDYVRDRASDAYYHAKDNVEDVRARGESMYNRARSAVTPRRSWNPFHHETTAVEQAEDLYNRAREYIRSGSGGSFFDLGSSYTQQAREAACESAQKAQELVCEGVNTRSWLPSMPRPSFLSRNEPSALDRAREAYEDAKARASGGWFNRHEPSALEIAQQAYEDAKAKASGGWFRRREPTALERAEQAYEEARAKAANAYESARDSVTNVKDRVTDKAEANYYRTKDQAHQAQKGVVQGMKDAVKDVKDTIVGAGQAVKGSMTGGNTNEHEYVIDDREAHRGPTKVKVEIQEL